jgi:hypothetical protein
MEFISLTGQESVHLKQDDGKLFKRLYFIKSINMSQGIIEIYENEYNVYSRAYLYRNINIVNDGGVKNILSYYRHLLDKILDDSLLVPNHR